MERATAPSAKGSLRQFVLPATLALVVVASLVGVVAVARQAGEGGAPAPAGPMAMPQGPGHAAFTVKRAEGDRIAVSGGTGAEELRIPAGAPAWRLEPATPAVFEAGRPVVVVGVPNEVRNLTIRAIVVGGEPAVGGTVAEGVAGPFSGHEVFGEPTALPVISGVVARVEGDRVVLTTAAGEVTVWVTGDAPLLLARRADPAEVTPGDRVAVLLDASAAPDLARGMLLQGGE
jgi:hypothetical protein